MHVQSDHIIDVENFNLSIGNKSILNDINLSVCKGEIMGIIGPSGSGKSMLLKSFLALFENINNIKIEGSISFDNGRIPDIFSLDNRQIQDFRREKTALIMQQSSQVLNPSQKVVKLLSSTRNLNISAQRIDEVLQITKLNEVENILDRYPHELSGGQLQRLLIAKAIISDAEVLLVDEPTSNLDAHLKNSILDIFKNLNQNHNKTIVIVSHNIHLLSEYVDSLAVIYKGRIVEKGQTEKVLTRPDSEVTKKLLATNLIEKSNANNEDSKALLSLKGISFSYSSHSIFSTRRRNKIFNEYDIELFENEILGITGPSGSGKSTLARIMAGLSLPAKGDVTFDGQNVLELRKHELRAFRKHVQIIFQDPFSAMPPHYRAGNVLREVFRLYEQNPSEVELCDYLSEFGLEADVLSRRASELSGGQRQRLLIARSLIPGPRVLICDEILSSLDVPVQHQVLKLLHTLKSKRNMSIVFISHDQERVKEFCDRIIKISP